MAQQPADPGKKRIKVEMPHDLTPVYSNSALVTHTASEIIIDLGQIMPNTPNFKVQSRVVMTPMNAKLMLRALTENLQRFEKAHGAIKLPPGTSNLADQLFRPPPQE